MSQVLEAYDAAVASEEFKALMIAREMAEHDEAQRLSNALEKKGMEKGMAEQAAKTTFEMFKRGFDFKLISDCVRMPIEWVEKTVNEAKLRS